MRALWAHGISWLLALLCGGLALPFQSMAQPVSSQPFPMIETGIHTATVNRIAVDAAGRYAVTASDDKTARVWDLATGKLLSVLRVPVGDGSEGKLYAVAVSPDGGLVALGGFTAPSGSSQSIYMLDRVSGRMLGRISGLPEVVLDLAFSPDGRHLAAALWGRNGIRIFSARPPWTEAARDADYQDQSYSVDFDGTGRLVVTSLDGKLRLYDSSFRRIGTPREVAGGKRPFFARFSPDGRRIAVGFHDSTAVSVVAGDDLRFIHAVDTRGADNGNLSSVAWSVDGQTLYAAGRNSIAPGQHVIRAWSQQGLGPMRVWPVAVNTVMDLRSLPLGRLVFAASDPAWGIVDAQGRLSVKQAAPILDHRTEVDSFRVSTTSDVLEFPLGRRQEGGGDAPLARFDVRARTLHRNVTRQAGLIPPRITGILVRDWRSNENPTLDGRALELDPHERARSLAISADAQRFALGAEWSVYLFGSDGQRVWRTTSAGHSVAGQPHRGWAVCGGRAGGRDGALVSHEGRQRGAGAVRPR